MKFVGRNQTLVDDNGHFPGAVEHLDAARGVGIANAALDCRLQQLPPQAERAIVADSRNHLHLEQDPVERGAQLTVFRREHVPEMLELRIEAHTRQPPDHVHAHGRRAVNEEVVQHVSV